MNVATVQGVTGPGKSVKTVQGDFQEISLRVKKKIIEIVGADGNISHYDMARAKSVLVTTDGENFTITVTAKPDDELVPGPQVQVKEEDIDRTDKTYGTTKTLAPGAPRPRP